MDADRFDHLTRALRTRGSRRAAVGGLLAGLLGFLIRTETVAKKKSRADGRTKADSEDRNTKAKAEACIPTGKTCPAKKPRGKKKDTLSCKDCCQGVVVQATNRKGKRLTQCSCRGAGTPCDSTNAAECCAGAAACQGGVCGETAAAAGLCNGANCRGCCDGAICREGDTQNFCGRGGAPCVICGAGQACDAGACLCNGRNCPNGCCDAQGVCQTGTIDGVCGRNGEACGACPTGETCGGGSPGTRGVCGCTALECPTGQMCAATSQTCQACSAAASQPTLCDENRTFCGIDADTNQPCSCIDTTTAGGSVCTNSTICFSAGTDPICFTDADCLAQSTDFTRCIDACPEQGCVFNRACARPCT